MRPGAGEGVRAPDSHAEWELPAEPSAVGTIRSGVREFARERGGESTRCWSTSRWPSPRRSPTPSCTPSSIASRAPSGPASRRRRTSSWSWSPTTAAGCSRAPDSPGLGLGLPTIASLTTAMDMHAPPGGGTVVTMTFTAPGVTGPARRAARESELLEEVARIVEGTWPGEGVERLVDLLVPELADACALDVMDAGGHPQRFAGRIDGPDGAAPVRLAGGAQAAHRPAAVRRPPGDRRRRPARRRAHPEHIARITRYRRGRRRRWPRPASAGGS